MSASPATETGLHERSLSPPLVVSLLDGVVGRGHTFRFRAGGGSMFPFIRDGDIVSVAPLDNPPRLGDVLAFNRGPGEPAGHLVVHRLVGCSAAGFKTRGDSHPPGQSDGLIPPEALLGRIVRVERGGRPIRLGLGAERTLIAHLSRLGLLWVLLRVAILLYHLLPRSHA